MDKEKSIFSSFQGNRNCKWFIYLGRPLFVVIPVDECNFLYNVFYVEMY
jgi:hypothetical protein